MERELEQLRRTIEESANGLSAAIGQLEDKLSRPSLPPPAEN
jgi:hypothetical protein